jgi:tetratricopeptide (TPR) repeat protein
MLHVFFLLLVILVAASASEQTDRWRSEAEYLLEQERPLEALELYKRVVLLEPLDQSNHMRLGMIFATAGDHTEAVACYLHVLSQRVVPRRVAISLLAGKSFSALGQFKNAQKHLDQVMANPQFINSLAIENREEVYVDYAEVLNRNGEHIKAINIVKRMCRLRKSFQCYELLGKAYWFANNSVLTVEAWNTAVQMRPDLENAYGVDRNRLKAINLNGGFRAERRSHGLEALFSIESFVSEQESHEVCSCNR